MRADRLALDVVGGFIVAALEMLDLEYTEQCVGGAGKIYYRRAYKARLLARIDTLADLGTVSDTGGASPDVLALMGQRVPGFGGGPVYRY